MGWHSLTASVVFKFAAHSTRLSACFDATYSQLNSCRRHHAQGLEHSRMKPTVTRHTPEAEMPRYKAVVRFQVRLASAA